MPAGSSAASPARSWARACPARQSARAYSRPGRRSLDVRRSVGPAARRQAPAHCVTVPRSSEPVASPKNPAVASTVPRKTSRPSVPTSARPPRAGARPRQRHVADLQRPGSPSPLPSDDPRRQPRRDLREQRHAQQHQQQHRPAVTSSTRRISRRRRRRCNRPAAAALRLPHTSPALPQNSDPGGARLTARRRLLHGRGLLGPCGACGPSAFIALARIAPEVVLVCHDTLLLRDGVPGTPGSG